MVVKEAPRLTHGLYIDMNGLIHPCCHSEDDPSVALRTDTEKIEQVCLAVDAMVECVQPTTVLYLAMDGVAPRAKMNQQRARRYMAAADKYGNTRFSLAPRESTFTQAEKTDAQQTLHAATLSIHDAHGLYQVRRGADRDEDKAEQIVSTPASPNSGANFLDHMFRAGSGEDGIGQHFETTAAVCDADCFDSNCISPGTEFMTLVAEALRLHICQRVGDDSNASWRNLTVLLSDTNTPGEGEHKIIDFLRTQSSHRALQQTNAAGDPAGGAGGGVATGNVGCHVIVGLDADLILLCLSLHIPNVIIMRDHNRSGTTAVTFSSAGRDVAGVVPDEERTSPSRTPIKERSTNNTAIPADQEASTTTAHSSGTLIKSSSPPKRYEYYSIDAVGNAIVSELFAVSKLTGVVYDVLTWPEHQRQIEASNGYCYNFPPQAPPGGSKGRARHPLTEPFNFKAIDDFVAMATLMGNDFVPRVPSAFCGDSAMDNLCEVYARCVLPYGFLTTSNDLHLDQLERLFSGYAKVETMLFRQQCIKDGILNSDEAATSSIGQGTVDDKWRGKYYGSTSISTDPIAIDAACRSYIEGLRFVWRYYTLTGLTCSWSWYYRFHHTPLAIDLAAFLKQYVAYPSDGKVLMPPAVEKAPPAPFSQLMCILPPTSSQLLPRPFRRVMLHPSPELKASTFPSEWTIDYAGANGKEHLAVIELPFADFPSLARITQELMLQGEAAKLQSMTAAERLRNVNRDFHYVFFRKRTSGPTANQTIALVGLQNIASVDHRAIINAELVDLSPVPARLKTYSSTSNVRNLTAGYAPGGRRRFGPSTSGGPARRPAVSLPAQGNDATSKRIAMNFGDFIVAVAAASSFFFLLSAIPDSLNVVGDVWYFAFSSLLIALLLGCASTGQESKANTAHVRNSIRDTHVDWLCTECLSLNFSRNERCFKCSAPFDTSRTWAVFTNKIPQTPPALDPNHDSYRIHLKLVFPDAHGCAGDGDRVDDEEKCDML